MASVSASAKRSCTLLFCTLRVESAACLSDIDLARRMPACACDGEIGLSRGCAKELLASGPSSPDEQRLVGDLIHLESERYDA